jgi:hypothetical protein
LHDALQCSGTLDRVARERRKCVWAKAKQAKAKAGGGKSSAKKRNKTAAKKKSPKRR